MTLQTYMVPCSPPIALLKQLSTAPVMPQLLHQAAVMHAMQQLQWLLVIEAMLQLLLSIPRSCLILMMLSHVMIWMVSWVVTLETLLLQPETLPPGIM